MQRARLVVPNWLEAERIAGVSIHEHWRRRLAPHGWELGDAGPELDAALLAAPIEGIVVALGDHRPPTGPVVTDLDGLREIEREVVAETVRALARGGVRIHGDGVWVEATVEVTAGAVLWGGCVLRGATRIGARAVIHPGAVLDDTEVGARSEVKAHSVCSGARIGEDCAVGPMAHLRPGTVLTRDVKVGNFVEVKASMLQPGVRASHLTYLGDALVGAAANIGAGTITCNYDGFGKHRTEIGAGAFIGSNTALVAPIRVGAGAIVGAGSTVTRDVPDEALMVERAEERVLPNAAPRVRDRNKARAGKG